MRLGTFSLLAGFSLTLSACGGGGDVSETTASETNAEETMKAAEEGGAMLPEDAGGAMLPSAEVAAEGDGEESAPTDQAVQDALADAEREADAAADAATDGN